ncbi:conserved hypothetical protein [Ricinus communis]|uniref:Uncharacterized protein n=1 Tax=Ricinus communis TaxID=3988 RepID=B9SAM5_RICCO|nr:conserved hypothetical protein [Ricinus communis]
MTIDIRCSKSLNTTPSRAGNYGGGIGCSGAGAEVEDEDPVEYPTWARSTNTTVIYLTRASHRGSGSGMSRSDGLNLQSFKWLPIYEMRTGGASIKDRRSSKVLTSTHRMVLSHWQ